MAKASWIQSSRLERRIRASNEEVCCSAVLGDLGSDPADGGTESSRGRSVKLV